MAEICRHLGYPRETIPVPRIADRIDEVVKQAAACLTPRGTYSLYDVTHRTSLSLEIGGTSISGNVGEFFANADRIAVYVVTAGEKISEIAADAGRNGDPFAAWVMDAVGSWAAEAATDALMERIRVHLRPQEMLTLRYSPGYCGMNIDQQRILFRMAPANSIGVKLLPSLLMYPLKSTSGIVGLGQKESISVYGSPCDYCAQVGCHMRR